MKELLCKLNATMTREGDEGILIKGDVEFSGKEIEKAIVLLEVGRMLRLKDGREIIKLLSIFEAIASLASPEENEEEPADE